MQNSFLVSANVRDLIKEIITENGMNPSSSIEYGQGAEIGEGYNSRTVTINVRDEKKELHLFLKMQSDLNWHDWFDKMFSNEILFYTAIYPAYLTFLKEHNVEDGFRNAPKCYGTKSDIVVLENLKLKNYTMFDTKSMMDEEHIALGMKTLAKFHAISFAFKDQKKEVYDKLVQKINHCVTDIYRKAGFDKITTSYIKLLLSKLDPVEDKDILEGSCNLVQILIDALFDVDKNSNEYSILTQGDCWNNNLLYQYDDNNPNVPTDLMLVDWQLVRFGSPAVDLGYFFYPMASESTIEDFERYMKIYYDELSKQIRQLGSDPEILYPFTVLKEEWKRFVKYGFAMSFIIIQGLVMEQDELPDFSENPDAYNDGEHALPKMKNEDVMISRLKTILRHFVKHNFL